MFTHRRRDWWLISLIGCSSQLDSASGSWILTANHPLGITLTTPQIITNTSRYFNPVRQKQAVQSREHKSFYSPLHRTEGWRINFWLNWGSRVLHFGTLLDTEWILFLASSRWFSRRENDSLSFNRNLADMSFSLCRRSLQFWLSAKKRGDDALTEEGWCIEFRPDAHRFAVFDITESAHFLASYG